MELSLFYPIKPKSVNQPFGVNGDYYRKNGINIDGHNGIDFKAIHGQPVYAAHNGLAFFETDDRQGHGVVLHTDKPYDDGKGGESFYKTIYWHLCDSTKEPKFRSPIEGATQGIPVKAGDLIGYADNTGLSSGDHLHFGLKPEAKTGEPPFSWFNTQQNNGYLGCIDPVPFFNGSFAEDMDEIIAEETKLVSLASQTVGAIAASTASPVLKSSWLDTLGSIIKQFISKRS